MAAPCEEACAAPALPGALEARLANHRWYRSLAGEAGGAVYRLDAPDGTCRYLKHGVGGAADDVADEVARLRWLSGQAAVPALIEAVIRPDAAWMLTSAVAGRTAYELLHQDTHDPGRMVDALAEALRAWHALPVDHCPFRADHRLRMAAARDRIDARAVDEDDFDEERAGWSAEQVWAAMQAHLPVEADAVVTHGDFSLDNILIAANTVSGVIDVGRAGVADGWQDLAILWSGLGEFGAPLQQRLLDRYGISDDAAKRQFHLLLDECF